MEVAPVDKCDLDRCTTKAADSLQTAEATPDDDDPMSFVDAAHGCDRVPIKPSRGYARAKPAEVKR